MDLNPDVTIKLPLESWMKVAEVLEDAGEHDLATSIEMLAEQSLTR